MNVYKPANLILCAGKMSHTLIVLEKISTIKELAFWRSGKIKIILNNEKLFLLLIFLLGKNSISSFKHGWLPHKYVDLTQKSIRTYSNLLFECENDNNNIQNPQMIDQPSSKPVLIYFKIRGNAQIIRSVLLEIGIQFSEEFVTNKGYLSPDIVQKYSIEMEKLPYLIHNGTAINDVFPIIKYLCIYYNRGDLLGKTIQDSIKIAEILVKYSKERNTVLSTLVQGIQEIDSKNLGEQALQKLSSILTSVVAKNKYCQATEKMFQKTGQFLCGYLTILDFIFYQKCFYFVNMLTVKYDKGKITSRYVAFYQQTPFFQKNKEYLNKFKLFFQEMNIDMNNIVKKMWIGDPKFISEDNQPKTS